MKYANTINDMKLRVTQLIMSVALAVVGFFFGRCLWSRKTAQRRRESLPGLLLQCPDAVIMMDSKTNVIEYNTSAEQLFGYEREEVIGKGIEIFIPPSLQAIHKTYMKQFKRTGEFMMHSRGREVNMSRRDGTTFRALLSLSTVAQGEDFVLAAFVRDLSTCPQKEVNSSVLLHNMLPQPMVNKLIEDPTAQIVEKRMVSILFSDLVGFTRMSSTMEATQLVQLLQKLFSKWESLLDNYGLEKIKTIGDGFMVCGGEIPGAPNHAERVLRFSIAMIHALHDFNVENAQDWQVRIGINSGEAVGGVFGKTRMVYDLFGDEVNMASRMESTGVPGGIHISENSYKLLKGMSRTMFTERTVDVKGKGITNTFLYMPPADGA